MYYTSQNRSELVAYNEAVNSGEGYNGTTTQWADIIEHPNGIDFAILKHDNYEADLTIEETLGTEWFPQNEIS